MLGLAPWLVLSAAPQMLPAVNSEMQSPSLEMTSENDDELVVEFTLPALQLRRETIYGKNHVLPQWKGGHEILAEGFPAVPAFSRDIEIPPTGSFRVEVVETESRKLALGPVAPSQGDLERSENPLLRPRTFSKEIYAKGQLYPASLLGRDSTFIARGRRGMHLELHPVQYDARTGLTTIHSRIKIRIVRQAGFRGENEVVVRPEGADALDATLDTHFLNGRRPHGAPTPPRVLFVTHDSFADALAPLVEAKRQKGETVWVSKTGEVGTSPEAIKAHIQKLYDSERVSHVVLVGDAEFVPYMKGTAGNVRGNEADPMYALLEGGDSYPDAVVGRLSAKTPEEVATQVSRTILYEKKADEGDTAWRTHHLGIASNEGTPTDFERMNALKEVLARAPYERFTDVFDPGARASRVKEALEEGVGYVNYIGHGSKTSWVTSGFSNANVNALGNAVWPFIVSVACVNGDFGSGADSFAERWLKAGTPEKPAGAIAIFASSTNQSWIPPTVGQRRIAELVANGETSTVGELFFAGSLAVLEDNSDTAVQTFQSWHIFGDPSVSILRPK